jgi:hypothetical protein
MDSPDPKRVRSGPRVWEYPKRLVRGLGGPEGWEISRFLNECLTKFGATGNRASHLRRPSSVGRGMSLLHTEAYSSTLGKRQADLPSR